MPNILMRLPPAKPTTYPISIEAGLLKKTKQWLSQASSYSSVVIITDNNVKSLYANSLASQLKKQHKKIVVISLPAGEQSKSAPNKQKIETILLKNQCDRATLILALGGGVIGDLAGFTAATYMRGIAFMQLPTTLLAMVDSSVGGKTGINTSLGKNLIGAFYQPKAVIADIDCLHSLSEKEFINGLVEALKYFLIYDKKQFMWAKNNLAKIVSREKSFLQKLIYHSVLIKSIIVQKDEKENNLRMICNLGHTIGHALEKVSHYKVMHGYAVAFGILVEAKIAELLGFLNADDFYMIQTVFAKLGILGHHYKKYSVEKILSATKSDKKNRGGKTRYVLLERIGKINAFDNAFAQVVLDAVVRKAIKWVVASNCKVASG